MDVETKRPDARKPNRAISVALSLTQETHNDGGHWSMANASTMDHQKTQIKNKKIEDSAIRMALTTTAVFAAASRSTTNKQQRIERMDE